MGSEEEEEEDDDGDLMGLGLFFSGGGSRGLKLVVMIWCLRSGW